MKIDDVEMRDWGLVLACECLELELRQPFGQRVHDPPPLGIAHRGPASDFRQGAATAQAQSSARLVGADFHARRFHEWRKLAVLLEQI